jgi:hypothetical protein
MLALDSDAWARLTHAYGRADDIPRLLDDLARNPHERAPREEPWFTLWSFLCHQGEAYEASYAAVPHLVAIAAAAAGPIDASFFQLPAAIEIARLTGHAPALPEDLAAPYRAALRDMHRVAFLHADDPWDRSMALAVATALVASKGDARLAEALQNLDDDYVALILADDR